MTNRNGRPPPPFKQRLRDAWQTGEILFLLPSPKPPEPGTIEAYWREYDEAFGDHNSPEQILINEQLWDERRARERQQCAAAAERAPPWSPPLWLRLLHSFNNRNPISEHDYPVLWRANEEIRRINWLALSDQITEDAADLLCAELRLGRFNRFLEFSREHPHLFSDDPPVP